MWRLTGCAIEGGLIAKVCVSGVVPESWDGGEEYLRELLSGNIELINQES
jgi:hypothetical protein